MRVALIVIGSLVAMISIGLGTGYVGYYNGVNKGVTVGTCGVEIVGTPGFFCGDY